MQSWYWYIDVGMVDAFVIEIVLPAAFSSACGHFGATPAFKYTSHWEVFVCSDLYASFLTEHFLHEVKVDLRNDGFMDTFYQFFGQVL